MAVFSQLPAFSSAYFDLQAEWTKNFNAGVTALDSNLYGVAEPLLKEAVSLSQRFGADDPRCSKSLAELGRLYTIRRRYAEAEPLLEQELHFKEVELGKNTGKTIPAIGSLVKFYMMYGTASKAAPLTDELISFVEGKLREDQDANAERMKAAQGKLLSGWAGTAPPGTHIPRIEWAVTCDRLGDLYRHKKEFEVAERLYKGGLDIKSTVIGKEHMSMALSYDSLGILAMDRGEEKDAEQYFRQALDITERILGPGSAEVYPRLDRLAKCLIAQKKYKEAEEAYNTALGLWKNEPNAGGTTARCLYQLGTMYSDMGRYSAAANVLHRALNLSMRSSGPLSYTNVAYMRKYAYALYYCGRRGESDGWKARANWLAGGMDETPAQATTKTASGDKSDKSDKAVAKTATDAKAPGAAKAGVAAKNATDAKTVKGGDDKNLATKKPAVGGTASSDKTAVVKSGADKNAPDKTLDKNAIVDKSGKPGAVAPPKEVEISAAAAAAIDAAIDAELKKAKAADKAIERAEKAAGIVSTPPQVAPPTAAPAFVPGSAPAVAPAAQPTATSTPAFLPGPPLGSASAPTATGHITAPAPGSVQAPNSGTSTSVAPTNFAPAAGTKFAPTPASVPAFMPGPAVSQSASTAPSDPSAVAPSAIPTAPSVSVPPAASAVPAHVATPQAAASQVSAPLPGGSNAATSKNGAFSTLDKPQIDDATAKAGSSANVQKPQ